ncbi:hypothetical protein NDU88_006846 [Pleurodeles waltl]|uniref:Uncharacterized protein n=1 Tax=Pleurodeles waltl TaxID=8319 RepID=A0AAV7UMX3_PLEWA|nr:hypothetical protein NDU88_006846 [Pleurodeles waltl]
MGRASCCPRPDRPIRSGLERHDSTPGPGLSCRGALQSSQLLSLALLYRDQGSVCLESLRTFYDPVYGGCEAPAIPPRATKSVTVEGCGQAAKYGVRVIPWLRRDLLIIRSIKPDLGASREIVAGGALGVQRGAAGSSEEQRGAAGSSGARFQALEGDTCRCRWSRATAAWCAARRPGTEVVGHARVGCPEPPGASREEKAAPDLLDLPQAAWCVALGIAGAV